MSNKPKKGRPPIVTGGKGKAIIFKASNEDIAEADLIARAYNCSRSQAIRIALRAEAKRIAKETEQPQ